MINRVLKFTKHQKKDLIQKGVYKLWNTNRPEKVYIGSTFDKNGFFHRWYCHLLLLEKNKHFCPHLQAVANKYGIENFIFEIIETCDNKENSYLKEKEYIDSYDKTHILLNTVKEAYAAKNRPVSDKTKELLSNAMKGKRSYDNRKKIYQYFPNLSLIEWQSSSELAINEKRQRNFFYFKGNHKFFNTFLLSKIELNEIDLTRLFSNYNGNHSTKKKKVEQYTLEGELVKTWNSGAEAEKFLNVKKGNISQAVSGKIKSLKGFIWKRKN